MCDGASHKKDFDFNRKDEEKREKMAEILVEVLTLWSHNLSEENLKNMLHHIMMDVKAVETRNSKNGSFREEGQVKIVESQLRGGQAGQNPFSVGQIVRMLDDESTFKEMQTNLGNKVTHLMTGQVGCVSKVDDGQKVSLELLDTSLPTLTAQVQSNWIEFLPISVSQRYETLFKLKWKLSDLLAKSAKEGDLHLVQLLVQNYQVKLDEQDRSKPGLTALHLACLEGRLNVIEWFLSEPKNKELLLEKEDYKGRRAIYFAVKGCQMETLNVLIKNGADVNPQTTRGRKTPLHKAVTKMNVECVILLIDNYSDVNLQDSEGNTPLHYLVAESSIQFLDDVFKALVKSGRIDFKIKNVKGHTAFHSAVVVGNVSAVRFMLESEKGEITLERVTETGLNALHLACIKGNLQIGKLLLDPSYGLINASNNSGQTPLMVACWKGFSPLIELLVKAGADVNAVDDNCDSAISLMIRRIYLDDRHCEYKTKITTIFPSTEESPEIYKIYYELSELPNYKETMEKHPSIASVCYLIKHGGDLDSGRHWMLKVRDTNVKVILEGFSSEWKMSVDEERAIVHYCLICNKPASRMRFICCGNESCLFCFTCRTKNVKRCPCCNSSIKPNYRPFPIIVLDDDGLMTNPLEPDNDSDDSLLVNQQPSNPKLDDNNLIQQSTDVSTATSSDPSLIKEVFERPTLLPITQIDSTPSSFEDSNSMHIPATYILSPISSSPEGEPIRNPKWTLREKGSRKGTDLLEDGLGNYYTRRSVKVWQCTRQSNTQKNKCPATVRNVGGQYILSKSHRHSTLSKPIARSYCNTYPISNVF